MDVRVRDFLYRSFRLCLFLFVPDLLNVFLPGCESIGPVWTPSDVFFSTNLGQSIAPTFGELNLFIGPYWCCLFVLSRNHAIHEGVDLPPSYWVGSTDFVDESV